MRQVLQAHLKASHMGTLTGFPAARGIDPIPLAVKGLGARHELRHVNGPESPASANACFYCVSKLSHFRAS